jgi:protein-S-isoprenylcysteine O-methyltransferase Ste14
MALVDTFENQGNYLFRNRGVLPAVLVIMSVPVVYLTPVDHLGTDCMKWITILAVFLSSLGFFIRSWAIGTTPKGTSGRNTEGQVAESLNTLGIYSIVRHPLYLGNYFMWIGIIIFIFNLWFVLLVSLAFWIYYERIMYAEERFLERKFGQAYMDWTKTVPAFIPDIRKYQPAETAFSFVSVLRREYSGFLATVISFAFIDYLRVFFQSGELKSMRLSAFFLISGLIITLILRTLKHNTRILDEEGRS